MALGGNGGGLGGAGGEACVWLARSALSPFVSKTRGSSPAGGWGDVAARVLREDVHGWMNHLSSAAQKKDLQPQLGERAGRTHAGSSYGSSYGSSPQPKQASISKH